jgi:hypothetical protein
MSILELSQILGNFGEFVGAIAVVATLIYLATQVRDAGRAAQFTAVQANRNQRMAFWLAGRESSYIPAIFTKVRSNQPLDEEESIRLSLHHSANWGLIYAEWVQKELGSAGEFQVKDHVLDLAIGETSSRVWWEDTGTHVYPDKFVAYVNGKLPPN